MSASIASGSGEVEKSPWWHNPFLVKVSIIVGSGGLIFGYDIGVISGTLSTLKDEFGLNAYEEGLVVSILYAGSIVGCIFGGPLCDWLGRWKTIHIQNTIFFIGALTTGFATDLTTLCTGRFLVGVASALSGLADVPYLTEIAPIEYRGVLSGQYEILVAFGILISFCLDLAFNFNNGWKIAFLLPGLVAAAQSMALFLLPESPKWLLAHDRPEDAYNALCAIHSTSRVQQWVDEYKSSKEDVDPDSIPDDVVEWLKYQETKLSRSSFSSSITESMCCAAPFTFILGSDSERFLMTEYFYTISMAVLLQILAQITGSNVVRNYAPTIFEDSGASAQLSLVMNVILGVIKLLFTTVGVLFIEKEGLGRRGFLLWGIIVVSAGMAFLTIASVVSQGGNLHNPYVFIGGCSLIYAGFGLGYGPVPWILSSEMVPTAIRGRIMSLSLIASNAAQLVTNLLFVPMTHAITTTGSFALFLGLNFATLLIVAAFLVETRDKQPSQILADLHRRYHRVTCRTLFRSHGVLLAEQSQLPEATSNVANLFTSHDHQPHAYLGNVYHAVQSRSEHGVSPTNPMREGEDTQI